MDITEEYLWCPECDAYRQHRPKRFETSIAIVVDEECVRCGHIFDRQVTFERKSSKLTSGVRNGRRY